MDVPVAAFTYAPVDDCVVTEMPALSATPDGVPLNVVEARIEVPTLVSNSAAPVFVTVTDTAGPLPVFFANKAAAEPADCAVTAGALDAEANTPPPAPLDTARTACAALDELLFVASITPLFAGRAEVP